MENTNTSKKGNSYIDELKAIYKNEIQLNAELPEKIQNAPNEELADAFRRHLQFTIQHLKRLEEIFITIGESAIIVVNRESEYGFE